MLSFSLLTAALGFSGSVKALSSVDLIDSLPLYGSTPTPHYSGYLDGTDGCDLQANGECKLHYWLALAEGDEPLEKPTVLWLNGGPGSSSLLGFFQELGPLLLNSTGGFMTNPWSWTRAANLLAIEAPLGVGYSYCAAQKESGKACENTDKFTASTTRAALVDFFGNKFPELAKNGNEFYIVGESYAGVYIPTLAKEILDYNDAVVNEEDVKTIINLVGVGVGDPCTDNSAQADSMDAIWYGYKNALVDETTYDMLWNKCSIRSPLSMASEWGKHLAAAHFNRKIHDKRLELLSNVDDTSAHGQLHDFAQQLHASLMNPKVLSPLDYEAMKESCDLAYRKFLLSSSNGLSQAWDNLYINDYSLFSPVTNKEDEDMATYMMRPDVRKAIHVEEAPTKSWPYADVGFDYTVEYDTCGYEVAEDAPSMIYFYKNIVPRLKKTWIYNGDTDPCVSYEGTRKAVTQFGFKELAGGSYRPWFYDQAAVSLEVLAEKSPLFGPGLLLQSMGAQFGGEIENYEEGLSFMTFHGSGHMVPQFRPQAALRFIVKLVSSTDSEMSPLLPSDKELANMKNKEFQNAMNEWTTLAKSSSLVEELPQSESLQQQSESPQEGAVNPMSKGHLRQQ